MSDDEIKNLNIQFPSIKIIECISFKLIEVATHDFYQYLDDEKKYIHENTLSKCLKFFNSEKLENRKFCDFIQFFYEIIKSGINLDVAMEKSSVEKLSRQESIYFLEYIDAVYPLLACIKKVSDKNFLPSYIYTSINDLLKEFEQLSENSNENIHLKNIMTFMVNIIKQKFADCIDKEPVNKFFLLSSIVNPETKQYVLKNISDNLKVIGHLAAYIENEYKEKNKELEIMGYLCEPDSSFSESLKKWDLIRNIFMELNSTLCVAQPTVDILASNYLLDIMRSDFDGQTKQKIIIGQSQSKLC